MQGGLLAPDGIIIVDNALYRGLVLPRLPRLSSHAAAATSAAAGAREQQVAGHMRGLLAAVRRRNSVYDWALLTAADGLLVLRHDHHSPLRRGP